MVMVMMMMKKRKTKRKIKMMCEDDMTRRTGEGGDKFGNSVLDFSLASLYENFVGKVPRNANSGPPPFSGSETLQNNVPKTEPLKMPRFAFQRIQGSSSSMLHWRTWRQP
eukprot:330521-Amphidinium_carterae.1